MEDELIPVLPTQWSFKYWVHTLSNMWYKPQYIPKLRSMGIFLLLVFPIDSYFHSFIKLRVDYGVFYFMK